MQSAKFLARMAAVAMALSASAAIAQTKWNLPAAYPANNYHSENLAWFADEVKKLTEGKLEVTVHPGASLFKAPEIKRAVATGQAQLGEVLISIHENEDPIFGLDTIPFLASSYPEAKKLWKAQKPAIEKKLDRQGIMVLFAVPWGPQGIYANKEINTVEDMKGLKMRTYNVGTTRIAELVGAQAVTVQAAELPQALATGTVNSFMTSGATGYDSKVWETMSYWYDVQGWIPKNVTIMSKSAFNALPPDQQKAILTVANAAELFGWARAEERSEWYVEQLKAKGMKILPPSDKLKTGLKAIGDQLVADWQKRAADDGKDVLAGYQK